MRGTLYGVGVGPGDPKLLTLLAVETIEKCPVIAVPDSGRSDNVALKIIEKYVDNKQIVKCHMPMTYDKNELMRTHKIAAESLCSYLNESDVCFVTLGDPTIYSTYIYVHNIVKAMGYETVLVPGVTSFCAVGAALNTELCIGNQSLHVIPAANENLEQYLDLEGVKVIMKSGQSITEICDLLTQKGYGGKAGMVEKCTMAEEKVYQDITAIQQSTSYFSTIIVKE